MLPEKHGAAERWRPEISRRNGEWQMDPKRHVEEKWIHTAKSEIRKHPQNRGWKNRKAWCALRPFRESLLIHFVLSVNGTEKSLKAKLCTCGDRTTAKLNFHAKF
ncbi:hypothetical protein O181_007166 [Austropuccinia psidii MF-1]|uniref:Uncharacterized protein n=1 Tax=Austropuccinia psidii MF-1 TaxID=1389203 RepID=A0A9Q3BMA0_9BASI|nr:hypothetical protein [Austropuccinia psidii MF-1]